jgi:hypothetical protein
MGSGTVYVVYNNWIQNPDAKKGCKTYKIGITTKSVSTRYYGLDLKMPSEFACKFAYKFDNEQYIAVEKKLQKILKQLNVGGEWYDLHDDTLDIVHDVCTQNGGILNTDNVNKEIKRKNDMAGLSRAKKAAMTRKDNKQKKREERSQSAKKAWDTRRKNAQKNN